MPKPLELTAKKLCPECGNEIKRALHSILSQPKTICVCGATVVFQTDNVFQYFEEQLTDLEKRIDVALAEQ